MTTFVLINASGKLLRENCATKWYDTERGAKSAATRIFKKTGVEWKAITNDEFEMNHNPLVEVISLMSGKPVMIRSSEVGSCVDPSRGSYWCQ